ncbi:MAG: penicillin-binding transpeptidase domain-containing protein, partial [Actinomycetota bacterium]
MDRRIRRLGFGLVGLFALLFAQLSYVQVIHADYIKARPANARRQIIAEYKVERGPILSADGVVLASSERNPERRAELLFQREYIDGPLYAGLTGYYSRVFGRDGLELAANPYLSGDAPDLAISTFTDLILGRERKGGAIDTTIVTGLQEAAAQALGNLAGAVVAIDPSTGDVLALVANPTYDPNTISSGTDADIVEAWKAITTDPDQPLISLAKDELFLPGSTGKLITASAALENDVEPGDEWPNPRFLDLPQTTNELANFGDSLCNGGSQTVSMADAFQQSCNVTFAEIGLELGAGQMSEQARAYGFCPTDPSVQVECEAPTIPFLLPWANGRFPQASYFAERQPQLAFSAIGLDNVLTNPLHMALIAGAIANDGVMMQPRLITAVRDHTGKVVRELDPEQYGQPISDASARQMRVMMLSVTEGGTASTAFSEFPIRVAGKTGTAPNGEDRAPNAWFTAFAPAGPGDRAEIAVAVIVLNGGA